MKKKFKTKLYKLIRNSGIVKHKKRQEFLVEMLEGLIKSRSVHFNEIADKIDNLVKKRNKIIVVVSAMGKTTDRLIKEYSQINNCYFNSDFDNIISTGEQISAGFLSSMLNKKKVNSLFLP